MDERIEPKSIVKCCDCMDFMDEFPDKYFDLAIVDPPYGRSIGGSKPFGSIGGGNICKAKKYKLFNDSKIPNKKYFDLLFLKSKNQIIWGGNYFLSYLYPSPCFIVWDKDNSGNNFADCELAWTSFKTSVRLFKYRWHGMLQENMKNKEIRIHPTQKPVALYKWLLRNYAKENDKILDTHMGSQSSRIAAYQMGFDYWGCEIDQDYFNDGCKRFKLSTLQMQLNLLDK